MLNQLHNMLEIMPSLLNDREGWKSLDVDYHPPRIERLWRGVGDYRVYLHKIYPCDSLEDDALFHPHPWPSAIWIADGRYFMQIGFGSGLKEPKVFSEIILEKGSTYDMTHRDTWHSVRALEVPCYTVMVTGIPWNREMPIEPKRPLRPCKPEVVTELLEVFRELTVTPPFRPDP